jgi:hypothetical protein
MYEVRQERIREVKRANDKSSGVTDMEINREENLMFKQRNDFNFDISKSKQMIGLFKKG